MRIPRPHLLPLVPLYAAGQKLAAWQRRPARWLRHPVISVGSVSAGGAGKTPMVLLLVELLRKRGWSPVILTRGYGRGSNKTERVDIAGEAKEFGDEPLLLARRSGVPVYVGVDRYESGMLAEEHAEEKTIYLLDDGFQHRRLGRDIDLALLTQRDTNDILLPAGDLREPVTALRRADILALRAEETRLPAAVQRIADPQRPPLVWTVHRRLDFDKHMPERPLAFCGIARPRNFFSMLRSVGCQPVAMCSFGDHHFYSDGELHRLIERAQRANANGFVTTEKDAVRLSPEMRQKLGSFFPVAVAQLHLELANEDAAMEPMLVLLAERHKQRPQS